MNLFSLNFHSDQKSKISATGGSACLCATHRQTRGGKDQRSLPQVFSSDQRSEIKDQRSSFSLIEIMVVVAIIAVLITLLVPSVFVSRTRARKAQAMVEVCNIATAIKMYQVEHGKWPNQTQGTNDTTYFTNNYRVINLLRFPDSNERSRVYLPVQTNSLDDHGNYVDPWGVPYIICMDENHDKTLSVYIPANTVYTKYTGEIITNSMNISNATRSGVAAISIGSGDETLASWTEID